MIQDDASAWGLGSGQTAPTISMLWNVTNQGRWDGWNTQHTQEM